MADDKILDQVETQETETKPQGESQASDIDAKIAEMEKKYKAEISGLNRKVSEIEKAKQTLELEKLSAEEAAAKKLEMAEARLNEINKQTRDLIAKNKLVNLGLSEELLGSVKGDDESEIDASVQVLYSQIMAAAEKLKKAEINNVLGGETPKAGATPDVNSYQSNYDTAKAKNDMPTMLAIKRAATKEGVDIKD